MSDSSVETHEPAAASASAVDADGSQSALYGMRRQRPPVVVKADLLPAISVLSLIGLLGIPLGWIWSRLAPPQRMRMFEDNRLVPLLLESWHQFDDVVIYTLLGLAAGVLTAAAAWLLRERRGPVVMIAAVAGSALAAWLGMRMGLTFVDSMYAVSDPPSVGDVVEQAPRLESGWVLLAQPMTTALVYGLLAGWNGRDDLGRRLG